MSVAPVSQLDGLKAIADFIEHAAVTRGIDIGSVTAARVWTWAKRRFDPLPMYRHRRRGGRVADSEAVTAWFGRQRFTISSVGAFAVAKQTTCR